MMEDDGGGRRHLTPLSWPSPRRPHSSYGMDKEVQKEEKTSVQRFLNQPTRRGRVLILARAGAGGTDTVDRALSCA